MTFGGAISGTGAVNQIGTGTTILTGANTYTGGTTISAGTLQLGNGGTTGASPATSSTTARWPSTAPTRSPSAARSPAPARCTQIGTGTTILTGANTYTGGTTISAGTLQIGNGGTTGAIAGNVAEQRHAGIQPLRRRDLQRRDLRHRCGQADRHRHARSSPAPTPTAAAPPSPPARCSSAMAAPRAASPATSTNNGTLAFNRTDAVTFGGAISGTGAVTQIGTGTHDPDRRQHLQRRHDDSGRDAAARQWRHYRQHRRRRDE